MPVLNRQEVDSEGRGPDEPDRQLGEEEAEDGGGLPTPTPRLSRTPARAGEAEEAFLEPGRDTVEILQAAGLGAKVEKLVKAGAVGAGESRSKL